MGERGELFGLLGVRLLEIVAFGSESMDRLLSSLLFVVKKKTYNKRQIRPSATVDLKRKPKRTRAS